MKLIINSANCAWLPNSYEFKNVYFMQNAIIETKALTFSMCAILQFFFSKNILPRDVFKTHGKDGMLFFSI